MDLYQEAILTFRQQFLEAEKTELREPTAMTLATVDERGRPSARTMLLKSVDESGFVFFTNSCSRKGRELEHDAHAALCFFWQTLMKQVRVEGGVTRISTENANAYWRTRPRDSQIGAWASRQSEPLDSRQTLLDQVERYREKFKDGPVPRPDHWMGFCLVPDYIEFWKSGWYRLHERISYRKTADGWSRTLLNP